MRITKDWVSLSRLCRWSAATAHTNFSTSALGNSVKEVAVHTVWFELRPLTLCSNVASVQIALRNLHH